MEDYVPLEAGQEAHWEVVERILFLYAKLNPGKLILTKLVVAFQNPDNIIINSF